MSHGKKHNSNACSKQRAKSQMACKQSGFKSFDHLLDLLQRKVRAQSLQLNLRKLTRVIQLMCAGIPQQHIHQLVHGTDSFS